MSEEIKRGIFASGRASSDDQKRSSISDSRITNSISNGKSISDARKPNSVITNGKSSISDDRKSTNPAAASSSFKSVVVKSADMADDLQKEAIDIAIAAFEKNSVEKDVAESIKKEFDKKHGPTWHCIVGCNFGSYVTHETNHFIYFYLDKKAVLLFKSG